MTQHPLLDEFCSHLRHTKSTINDLFSPRRLYQPIGCATNRVWRPSKEEEQTCCVTVGLDIKNLAWGMYNHCLSDEHLLNKFNLKKDEDLPLLIGHPDLAVQKALEKVLKGVKDALLW